MIKLGEKEILYMHSQLILASGGEDGVRDMNLLLSAIEAPFQSFDNMYLYPTLTEKASRLAYGIIKNHPFLDGNKRIGVLVMLVFLELNNVFLKYTDKELVMLGISVASGDMNNLEILEWINTHKIK